MTYPDSPPSAARLPGIENVFPGRSEMAALMRGFDWTRTPLGPPERWPPSLQAVVRLTLTSRYAIWFGWGDELTFLYNDAYAQMTLGAKHPWALGRPSREVWAEIWPQIGPRIERVLATGEATWDEGLLLFLERSGFPEETYHTFSYSPLADTQGIIRGHFCIVTEETDRIIGERRLALLKDLASQLAGARSRGEVLAGLERTLAAEARDLPFSLLYSFAEEDEAAPELLAHTGFEAALPPALAEGAGLWPRRSALDAGEPLPVPLPDGVAWPAGPWQRAPTSALVLPLAQQGQQRPAGMLVVGVNPYRPLDDAYRDFLKLFAGQVAAGLANAQAYEEERRRAEALAEIDRAKTIFFSNVSHEFRTPLTLMLGPLEDLRARAGVSAEVDEQLARVQRNGVRLLRLVNTLLDFSRLEAGRAQAVFEPVDLAEQTRDVASAFRSATDRAGLRLVVDCPPLGESVYVDRAMWEKVVLNLVSNAFKHTFEGEIEVSVRLDGDAAELRVRDTGTGIPASELPHLFERFRRVEGARGRTHEGSGIGLALVHELVRLHGGSVAVESEEGRGSVFTVRVPRGSAHLPAEHLRATASAASAPAAAGAFVEEALRWLPETPGAASTSNEASADDSTVAGGARPRVLLADDNADMRDYVRRLLAERFVVEAVANGREALEAIRRQRPHLVVTDVMMPELDGFGLLQALRADPQTRELPVLVLSARAGEEARLEGLEAGADDYLVKPFSARELLARVESQLLRARLRAVEEEHARRLGSVFEQAPVAVALLRGPEHVFELANPAYLDLVHQRPVVGKPVREALPEVDQQGVVGLLDTVYRSGLPQVGHSLPLTVNRPDGTPEDRFFDFVYQPLFDAAGAVEGVAAVVYDVTALARARREAEGANRAKDEFLAMLGHELRNPLAPILTALQLLKLRGIDAAERERRILERQVQHLVRLVDDLLDVSRITRGKIQLERAPVEVAQVVAKAIEMSSPLLEQQRHELKVDVERGGLLVDGDINRLAQVVSNLLTNAAKYTEPGGTVDVRAWAEDGQAVLRVRDNGVGIAPDVLPRIFDLFVQAPQSLDRSHGGLGLGLAIARSIVALHGGSITAASEGPGRGTEVIVRLPLARAAAGEALAPSAPSPELARAAYPLRILVVDDNRDAALLVASALELRGHRTACAFDGPQALAVAHELRPQVAILDLGLPVMDGYEVARRFAADPLLATTELVAVTGYGQERDRRRALAAGFRSHLVKPVDVEDLRAVVESLGAPRGAATS